MGVTANQIQANLVALGFSNPSATALYNKIAQAVGIPVDNTITEMTNTVNQILAIINSKNFGKSGYYTAAALAFQYGDSLTIDPVTLNYIYATIDPTKQIINQAAFESLSGELFIKVATLNSITGLLQALSAPQLAAFTSYFQVFELPGLPVSIISNNPNSLAFSVTVTYYSTYDLPTLQTAVVAAEAAFMASFQFNGEFFAGDLQDYIKTNVPGIRDYFIFNASIDGVPFQGSQSFTAGYFNYGTITRTYNPAPN